MKKKLTIDEQIEDLKKKGVTFEIMCEAVSYTHLQKRRSRSTDEKGHKDFDDRCGSYCCDRSRVFFPLLTQTDKHLTGVNRRICQICIHYQ